MSEFYIARGHTDWRLDPSYFPSMKGKLLLASKKFNTNLVGGSINLVDPQLYLQRLSASTCSSTCANLLSYPWFSEEFAGLCSEAEGDLSVKEVAKSICAKHWRGVGKKLTPSQQMKNALEFQRDRKCEILIAPSPMFGLDSSEIIDWFSELRKVVTAGKYNEPVYATISVSEEVLGQVDIANFAISIVSLIVSQSCFKGVYVVVCQKQKRFPFDVPGAAIVFNTMVSRAALAAFGTKAIVNFADASALVVSSFTEATFVFAQNQSERHLSFKGLEDSGGGKKIPFYFSRNLLGEIHVQEIGRLNFEARAIWSDIKEDSPFAMEFNDYVDSIVGLEPEYFNPPSDWQPTQGRVTSSNLHRLFSTAKLANGMEDHRALRSHVASAMVIFDEVRRKFGSRLTIRAADHSNWLTAISHLRETF